MKKQLAPEEWHKKGSCKFKLQYIQVCFLIAEYLVIEQFLMDSQ